jgi:AmmeMemoRadiSam system protein B
MGVLDIDTQKMEKVAELGVYDGSLQRAFEREHGVGALAPFIKREFPDAKIVPIFLAHGAPHERLQGLGRGLASAADDDTFIVVSSDMSHYLRHEDAVARDSETLGWFAHNDWPRLESATDKNTDSSAGLMVLHEYLNRSTDPDEKKFRLLEHVDSFDYSHDASNVTSYILGFWD